MTACASMACTSRSPASAASSKGLRASAGFRRARPPLCVRRGEGGCIEDVDGRRLIDYHAAYGAVLLGHGYAPVVQRVAEATRHGVLFGLGVTEAETLLAEKLVEHIPCAERVLLCGSGSEATGT